MDEDYTQGSGEAGGPQVQVEWLETDECWRLLQGTSLARLALISADGHPEIYPVNIRTDRGTILIQSADDAKTEALVARPHVAVEVDGGSLRVRWSVIVHATAEVTIVAPVAHRSRTSEPSWFPGTKTHSIRLTVQSITGRRFLMVAEARSFSPPERAVETLEPARPGSVTDRRQRPTPIPSHHPLGGNG